MRDDRRDWTSWVTAAAIAAAFVVPFLVKGFVAFQLTQVMIYAIAIVGLSLLTGINGQFSFGHSAFYAIGAYTAAILMDRWDVPYFWTLPAAGLVSFGAGFLFGLPALRLGTVYLALATLALAVATPRILKFSLLDPWTQGVRGITITKPDAPFGLPLSQDQWLYLVTLILLVALFAIARNLIGSRSGRALMAIRDNPIAARAMGVNVPLMKTLIFGVSALYTGVAGALGAILVENAAPDSFTQTLAVSLFVGLVVGGVESIPGALVGGAFILFVPNIAESVSKGLSGAIYGAALLLIVWLMPTGAAGLVERALARVSGRTR